MEKLPTLGNQLIFVLEMCFQTKYKSFIAYQKARSALVV